MINTLHLLWIVPVSAGLGVFFLALIIGGNWDE